MLETSVPILRNAMLLKKKKCKKVTCDTILLTKVESLFKFQGILC